MIIDNEMSVIGNTLCLKKHANMFDDFLKQLFVAIQWLIKMYMLLLHWRVSLSLHIFQGSAGTYFRWSWHFMQSLLSVYSRICLPIFIEIGSCSRDAEPKNVFPFFETQWIIVILVTYCDRNYMLLRFVGITY